MTVAQLDKLLSSFDWDTWSSDLRDEIESPLKLIIEVQGERDGSKLGIEFNAKDPFVSRHFTQYLGARITQLDETTRDLVKETLHAALIEDEAVGVNDLAGRLMESGAFAPSRALMIARTETATAYNFGALGAYHQAGVEEVEVSDGDGDEECADANGEVWSLDEALANPLAHPNCVRSFGPHISDEK